jgi:hypothetical protein
MEIRDWVTIFSVIVIVAGWFINSHLNRKHETFKKRLDYNLNMYQSYFKAAFMFEKICNLNSSLQATGNISLLDSKDSEEIQAEANEFVRLLEDTHVSFLLLGSTEQIRAMNKIVSLAQLGKYDELKRKLAEFSIINRNTFRTELGIDTTELGMDTIE